MSSLSTILIDKMIDFIRILMLFFLKKEIKCFIQIKKPQRPSFVINTSRNNASKNV